ncbi:hypothetical protein E2C05_31565, partial [Paracraurococcus ruber]
GGRPGPVARRRRAPGFTLVEAVVALAILGGTLAAILPPLAAALGALGGREAALADAMRAQSLLEAHAPPGATLPGRWEGPGWRVQTGRGEEGPRGAVLRPVLVQAGGVTLATLRPGPPEAAR